MRVLHITETFPPEYGGGAAIYTADVSHFLSRRGHAVCVVCAESAPGAEYSVRRERREGVDVLRVNLPYFKEVDPEGWELTLGEWRRHERRVSSVVVDAARQFRPDLIHFHTARPFGEGTLLDIARLGLPMVAMLHDAWLLCARVMLLRSPFEEACGGPGVMRCLFCMYSQYDRPLWYAWAKLPWRIGRLGAYRAYRLWRRYRARRVLDAAVGYSSFITEAHRRHLRGVSVYVPLGINLVGLPVDRPLRPRSPVRLGFVAGFQPTKGLLAVLDALAELRREGMEGFQLSVFGPSRPEDQLQIDRRGLTGTVVIRGSYDGSMALGIYNDMDVAIMATVVVEPFGRVPLEAAAVGVPTVAPAVGGIVESIRHGVDGLLYRFRNTADLKDQLARLLQEEGLISRLAANLRPVPDTRVAAGAIEEFYELVLSRRRG
jgi:glycosyltransferase involved in cell wall biosynthesis